MKKKYLILSALLFLSVGFASVSTTLGINGNVKIAKNDADFDVKFTKAILDGTNISSSAISIDGKKVTYRTSNLLAVGNKSTLNFEVTNYSEMYDAKVSVNCTAEANNSSYKITTSGEMEITGKMTGAGNVVVELLNSSVGDETFTCTLTTIEKERNTRAEETLPLKYIPKYFEFGNPTISSTQDYKTLKYTGTEIQAKVFVGLDADGDQKSVCIIKNGSLECFKNNNYTKEAIRIKQIFGEERCSFDDSYVYCSVDDFHCDVSFDGYVACTDSVASYGCSLGPTSSVNCEW